MAALRSSQALRHLLGGNVCMGRPAANRRLTVATTQCLQHWTQSSEAVKPVRQFHDTRQLRARGDSSTIDFAYLPETMEPPEPELYRVPILPDNYASTSNAAPEDPTAVMKPEISTMSADAVFLPMADMSDGHAMNIDFHAMADRVAVNLRQMKIAPEEQASMMKQIWSDLVDDMLGLKKKGGGESKS